MTTRVARSVIEKEISILTGNPTVGKDDIGNIANAFFTLGSQEIAARFMDDPLEVVP
jgi:hypothetical protein